MLLRRDFSGSSSVLEARIAGSYLNDSFSVVEPRCYVCISLNLELLVAALLYKRGFMMNVDF